MKTKILFTVFAVFLFSISTFAAQWANICVTSLTYAPPAAGVSVYKLNIASGATIYTYSGTSSESISNMKIWLSLVLAAKSEGKQVGILHEDNDFNIIQLGIGESNCP